MDDGLSVKLFISKLNSACGGNAIEITQVLKIAISHSHAFFSCSLTLILCHRQVSRNVSQLVSTVYMSLSLLDYRL